MLYKSSLIETISEKVRKNVSVDEIPLKVFQDSLANQEAREEIIKYLGLLLADKTLKQYIRIRINTIIELLKNYNKNDKIPAELMRRLPDREVLDLFKEHRKYFLLEFATLELLKAEQNIVTSQENHLHELMVNAQVLSQSLAHREHENRDLERQHIEKAASAESTTHAVKQYFLKLDADAKSRMEAHSIQLASLLEKQVELMKSLTTQYAKINHVFNMAESEMQKYLSEYKTPAITPPLIAYYLELKDQEPNQVTNRDLANQVVSMYWKCSDLIAETDNISDVDIQREQAARENIRIDFANLIMKTCNEMFITNTAKNPENEKSFLEMVLNEILRSMSEENNIISSPDFYKIVTSKSLKPSKEAITTRKTFTNEFRSRFAMVLGKDNLRTPQLLSHTGTTRHRPWD